MGFRIFVRIGIILITLLLHLFIAKTILPLFVAGLLISRFIDPRESYIFVACVGLILDLYWWRIAGLPVTPVVLVLLRACEEVLRRIRTTDNTLPHLVISTLVVTIAYMVPLLVSVGVRQWIVHTITAIISNIFVLTVLYWPVRRVGTWYAQIAPINYR
jgi:hypothetical protein